jgi:sulfide:quinone oxidoreductase
MKHQIVILGGGTGGTIVANRLTRYPYRDHMQVTVIDSNNDHLYQPGLLFVPFGAATVTGLTRPRDEQFLPGVHFVQDQIVSVDTTTQRVTLAQHDPLPYDVLVIATGSRLVPEETEGLGGNGWGREVFTFYEPTSATALQRALAAFQRGRIVVNVIDMPIRCPVAPLEFTFLADAYFTDRHLRDKVSINYVTPLDGAFTKPVSAEFLGNMFKERAIELTTSFNTGSVDEEARTITAYDGRVVPYDLLVVVPLHSGARFIGQSPRLGDALDFVLADLSTLQSASFPNIFALGDATGLPVSKAGSVTHFEASVLVDNIAAFLEGTPLPARFDGHTNCFIETGHHKALLIDFNMDHEPVPGHFPGPIGLPLLKESRLNHLGKLAFEALYWDTLLPGRDIPLVGSAMPLAGKELTVESVRGH